MIILELSTLWYNFSNELKEKLEYIHISVTSKKERSEKMIEIPEAINLAKEINQEVGGKRILKVIANHSPHKFAWYHGDPDKYNDLLAGKVLGMATGYGSFLEIVVEDSVILFSEGIRLKLCKENDKLPPKHQLLLVFDDSTSLVASVQMYGGLWCFKEGEFENRYYQEAKEKPSPLSDEFNYSYFTSIISEAGAEKLSAKALLATDQRIPGLGNGILQDILFNAGIHPKKRVRSFTEKNKLDIFESIRSTIADIAHKGGRDTEKNLNGYNGGYITKLSKNTVNKPCPQCGNGIQREAYMGGSIYYCSSCQQQ